MNKKYWIYATSVKILSQNFEYFSNSMISSLVALLLYKPRCFLCHDLVEIIIILERHYFVAILKVNSVEINISMNRKFLHFQFADFRFIILIWKSIFRWSNAHFESKFLTTYRWRMCEWAKKKIWYIMSAVDLFLGWLENVCILSPRKTRELQ